MNFSDIPALLVTLGVGGAVGALAAAVVASSKLREDFRIFASVFKAYMIGKDDPASQEISSRFHTLESDVASASNALERLKRAFKRK